MGLFWLVMGHVFHMISYVDCDVDCDMDSYMPGGGGMLTTDIEASRWSNVSLFVFLTPPFLSFLAIFTTIVLIFFDPHFFFLIPRFCVFDPYLFFLIR